MPFRFSIIPHRRHQLQPTIPSCNPSAEITIHLSSPEKSIPQNCTPPDLFETNHCFTKWIVLTLLELWKIWLLGSCVLTCGLFGAEIYTKSVLDEERSNVGHLFPSAPPQERTKGGWIPQNLWLIEDKVIVVKAGIFNQEHFGLHVPWWETEEKKHSPALQGSEGSLPSMRGSTPPGKERLKGEQMNRVGGGVWPLRCPHWVESLWGWLSLGLHTLLVRGAPIKHSKLHGSLVGNN